MRQHDPGVDVRLVVVGDGFSRPADLDELVINTLAPDGPLAARLRFRVRHLDDPSQTYPAGAKWNATIAQATGDWVLLWGDDDWYAPDRLVATLAAIRAEPDLDIVGDRRCLFHELVEPRRTFAFTYPTLAECGGDPMLTGFLVGGTVAVRRAFWEGHRFPTRYEGGSDIVLEAGSDSEWIATAIRRGARWREIDHPTLTVAMRHTENTGNTQTPHGDPWWQPWSGDLDALMGGMLPRFEAAWRTRTR